MKTFVLLLTLALLAILSAASATDAAVRSLIEAQPGLDRPEGLSVPAPVSFAGTWKTMAGGRYPYTVILKQVGDKVSGTYSPGNGKIFDGVVTDNKLRFKWTQDGGNEGTAEFIKNEDGKGFTGTSSALKPKEFTVTWNTYTEPVTSFAGTWETISFGQHQFQLTIVQTGTKVTGVYPRGNGKLEGTVTGRVLRFKWESDGGSGSGRLIMDEKEQAFTGSFNKGDNPDDVFATWNGQRSPVSQSAPGPKGKASGNEAEKKASEKDAPAAFAGVWRTMLGEQIQFPELLLQQASNKVTGRLFAGRPEFGLIKEGIVDRNTLRFQIWRPRPILFNGRPQPDEYLGTGELVMDADGKSFTGTILGAAASGTLIAR